MSKLIDSFYKAAEKPEMSAISKAVYVLCGIAGALFLITAYYNPEHQLLHQIGATAGILGMVLIGAISRIRKNGWKEYLLLWSRRDLAIAIAWGILLCIWVVDPTI